MKILIIEDEQELAKDMMKFLASEQYLCEWAFDFEEAMDKISAYEYDCILLDLMLPGGDGLSILNELKELNKQDGVIIISAKNSIEDKVKGLKLGADDYLAKPFHQAELAARIESLIRRKHFNSSNIIHHNEIEIDLQAKTVKVQNQFVNITKKEFQLLLFFVGNKNRVLSKSALAEHLSGDFADMFDNHDFVYAHVKNLKRKLKEAGYGDYIKTIYGTGYKWEQ
ncbi:DNA-binding response OmpR family regulator [Roseivirga pacifica]|uniref:DNA-binding response regulator, OmpR family, contains REC and winged-helix (WHTH) domain n=1 Tax=Roseivirga pacifica TaxID=1267423 RepID=A0A1I0Q214_9BACT|nr:response regulator transcription factor [Roseivirga pacifica]RKQ43347.1 DNA-binding response OmpR family regulator [Roseivirga pacifica]SEW20593.1 DNA-binding response regulator, OmpR family, contains REC and winged-helix (wHTH) domain [Roseivirga pacifica]